MFVFIPGNCFDFLGQPLVFVSGSIFNPNSALLGCSAGAIAKWLAMLALLLRVFAGLIGVLDHPSSDYTIRTKIRTNVRSPGRLHLMHASQPNYVERAQRLFMRKATPHPPLQASYYAGPIPGNLSKMEGTTTSSNVVQV